MLWKEKIRQMNDDELAEFIEKIDELNGFKDMACRNCQYFCEDGTCKSTSMKADCLKSISDMLNKEV